MKYISNTVHSPLRIVVFFISMVSMILFWQCKSNSTETSTNTGIHADSVSADVKSSTDSVHNDSVSNEEVFYGDINFLLPSPDEILSEVLTDKMQFDIKLLNSKKNASKYLETKQRALNLGVYLTDLAYVNYNENKTEALEYFKIVRDLAQKINIYKIFTESTYDRVQNNLTNKDSLSYISKEVYYNMLDELETSRRNNIYALVASGALIEALYLSTVSIKHFSEYQPVAQKVFEQKYVLNNFYEFASQYQNDPDVKSVLALFDNLKHILDGAGVKATQKSTVVEKNNQVVISGGEEIIVTEKTFELFKRNVLKTRQEIVGF